MSAETLSTVKVGGEKSMAGGRDPMLWAECVRANWQRLEEIRQARADQEILWRLLRQVARGQRRRHHPSPLTPHTS